MRAVLSSVKREREVVYDVEKVLRARNAGFIPSIGSEAKIHGPMLASEGSTANVLE
jgi:hypothetical protein